MKLISVSTKSIGDFIRLNGTIEKDNPKEVIELYFQYPKQFESFLNVNADAFVPALLIPCMLNNENLIINPAVSQKLINNISTIQDIFNCWYPAILKKIKVTASQPSSYCHSNSNNVGAFFSLGVDSFYTLLKNIYQIHSVSAPITHLIFINGLETPLIPKNDIKITYSRILEVASKTKKICIYGETNIRNIFPIPYEKYYCGACLASVAQSLSNNMGNVLIPSHSPYNTLELSGSHILLDHHWSSEHLNILHDGCELNRAKKIETIVNLDGIALDYLRTCTVNYGKEWNCGTCNKCLRTMTSLQAIDCLCKAKTYPHNLPNNFLKKLNLDTGESELQFAEESLELARKTNKDLKLVNMLSNAIRISKRKKLLKSLLKEFPLVFHFVKQISNTRHSH